MAESFRGRKGIIIGGGASGLMAAITAAKQGADVTVLEHTARPGKKILSTGNGKCNLTNLYMDPSCYRSDQSGFETAAIRNFPPTAAAIYIRCPVRRRRSSMHCSGERTVRESGSLRNVKSGTRKDRKTVFRSRQTVGSIQVIS